MALSLRPPENSDPQAGRRPSRLMMRSTTPPQDFVKDLANAEGIVEFFVLGYISKNYLRRVLLTADLTVALPYKAGADDLSFYRDELANYLELAVGIKAPRIRLESRN